MKLHGKMVKFDVGYTLEYIFYGLGEKSPREFKDAAIKKIQADFGEDLKCCFEATKHDHFRVVAYLKHHIVVEFNKKGNTDRILDHIEGLYSATSIHKRITKCNLKEAEVSQDYLNAVNFC